MALLLVGFAGIVGIAVQPAVSLGAGSLPAFAVTKPRRTLAVKSCPQYRFEDRGTVNDSLTELSGWALSKRHRDVLWAHNDSGEGARLHGVSTIDGSLVADIEVTGATATDWEDIATYIDADGQAWIVVADTGDNAERRESVRLVMVPEPELSVATAAAAGVVSVRWAGGPHDVEALVMDPITGDAILIGKRFSGSARVSVDVVAKRLLVPGTQVTSKKVGDYVVPAGQPYGPTGASISPAGTTLGLVFYANLTLLWTRSPGSSVADTLLRGKPCAVRTGFGQYEAIAIADDGSIITATEGSSVPLRAYVLPRR